MPLKLLSFSGDETHSYGLMDTSLHSFGLNEDGFGDEDMAVDLVGRVLQCV